MQESQCLVVIDVSIHASVRDATRKSVANRYDSMSFNPRIREGCDALDKAILFGTGTFQSTHP